MLPMRLVSARTGLSADVLRVWERRYGVVKPTRSPGGQRWYTEADVARLRLLARAVECGRNISSVAHLGEDALEEVVRQEEASQLARTTEHPLATQPYLADAIGAVESLNGTALEITLRQAALRLSIDELLNGLLTPLTHTIGDRWAARRLSAAHEHLATTVIRRLLSWITQQHTPAPGAAAIVITTPAGQLHELGAKLAAATAAANGWRVLYLGPNLSAADIATAVKTSSARAVGLSFVYPADDRQMDDELRSLRAELPETRIVAGGRAAAGYRPSLDAIQASVLTDLPSFRRWLNESAGA
jgi:DNA-binding transcriptional MerR regulator/methylmalonyl-CoA mutase cobalamin-binding subunit